MISGVVFGLVNNLTRDRRRWEVWSIDESWQLISLTILMITNLPIILLLIEYMLMNPLVRGMGLEGVASIWDPKLCSNRQETGKRVRDTRCR